MARSYGALKVTVWEVGSDFRALTPAGQWGYMMLISQPQLSNLGVLPYAPEKWVRFADALTDGFLAGVLDELAESRYIVVDTQTDELLVRTFIRHDKVWSQPKLVTNARKLIREVESDVIRDHLTTRHPWLTEAWPKSEIETYERDPSAWNELAAETPIETPSEVRPETPSETPIPTRARAGPGPGAGVSPEVAEQEAAVTRAHDLEAEPTAEPDAAAALQDEEQSQELELLLDDLAVPTSLRERARLDPDRALAVATYTIANAGTGAYFRTVFESGDWPTTNGNGHAPLEPAERRRVYVAKTGWLLPDDELEYQLRELGATDADMPGYTDQAADLRREHPHP